MPQITENDLRALQNLISKIRADADNIIDRRVNTEKATRDIEAAAANALNILDQVKR